MTGRTLTHMNRKKIVRRRTTRKDLAAIVSNVGKVLKSASVLSADKMRPAPRGRRTTMYQPILDRVQSLKVGKGFEIPPPDGVAPAVFKSRISAVFTRSIESGALKAPKNAKFKSFLTTGGKIGFQCVKK